jgi:hypothetical protein
MPKKKSTKGSKKTTMKGAKKAPPWVKKSKGY